MGSSHFGYVLIAKGSDLQDPELVRGLQPKTVAVECLRLSQPRLVPDGLDQDALKQCASRWQTIHTPDGKDLWLKMDTGQTQYTSPFVAEIKTDSSDLAEEPTAYWGEATDPTNAVVRPEVVARIIPNRIVMSTSGAQYDRGRLLTRSYKLFSRRLEKNQLQSCNQDSSPVRRRSSCHYWYLD